MLRLTSAFIAAGTVTGLATPAAAIISLHYYHGNGGGMHKPSTPTTPTPKPPKQTGSWGGGAGGHSGGGSWGCCNGSGGGHAGGGGHAIWTKPRLGEHAKGVHFYGMGGGSIRIGGLIRARIGSGAIGSWGGRAHAPSGTHPMGMHYYGMSGGLASKYGRLERDFGAPLHLAPRWSSGSWGHEPGAPKIPVPPVAGNPPPYSGGSGGQWGSRGGSHHAQGGGYVVRFSIKERFSYRVSSGARWGGGSHGSQGSSHGDKWGSPKPQAWAYGTR